LSQKPDYPYYDGVPVEIEGRRWLLLVGSVVLAFALLITLPFPYAPLNFIPPILYTGIPLLALAWASRGHLGALFHPVGVKQVAQAVGFGFLTIVASVAAGLVLTQLTPMQANPAAAGVAAAQAPEIALFMVRTAIQLVGEELMTILPLLAVLWLCVRKFGLSRRTGLIAGVIVSTLWFSAVHLPTYGWNFLQCFAGIGMARLVLTAAFLFTRNLWVSAGAHIVNDWTEFLLPTLLAGGHVPIDPGA